MRIKPIAVLAAVLLAGAGCTTDEPGETTAGTETSPTYECSYPATTASAAKAVQAPADPNPPTSGTLSVTLHLAAGDVVLNLDRTGAPCAVNSFESLAEQGYFDNTQCHRLVPGWILQCGDPSATGYGGPGYSFADELSGSETYPRGTVAMANSGADTNGSQFFLVIGDQPLSPNYTVLGTIDDASLAVLDAIDAAGVDPADPNGIAPAADAGIMSVSVGN